MEIYSDIPYDVDFGSIRSVIVMVENIMGAVLGVGAVFVIIVLFLITVLDICYMMIPPLQFVMRDKNWDGSADEGRKFRLISKDALAAVRESSAGEKSSLWIYLRKRLRTYIIAAIIIFLIIAGSDIIVGIVFHFVGKLIDGVNIN